MIWDAELLPIGWFDPELVTQEIPAVPVWVPVPVQNARLPQFKQPTPQSVIYSPTVDVVVPADAVVLSQVKGPVQKPVVSPRSVAVNVATTPAVVADAVVLPAQKVPQPQPVRIPRSVAFNPLAASPGVDDAFFISTQSQFAAANARVVPTVVGQSSSITPMEIPPVPPVEWVVAPVKPTHRSVGPPPRQAQSQTFNPLAASPGVDDPFFIRNVAVPQFVPRVVGHSSTEVPFIPDAYVPPQTQPVRRAEPKKLSSSINNVYFTPPVAETWVPPTIKAFRHTTTPKPQTVCYQPNSSLFEEPPWLIVVQLYDPNTQGPKSNKQAKSRVTGAFTPNVAPNVILSPWIQSAQYAARIRGFKLHPSSTRWFPGGIYAGPTDPGAPLEGRNELGDLVGAGAGRGAAGGAGGASGRGSAGSAGAGTGRGSAGSAGSGSGRGTPDIVGPGGGRS